MKKRLALYALLLTCCLLAGACKAEEEDYHIDFSDPSEGIYTAAELLAFFEEGQGGVVRLGDNLDLDGEMLRLTKERGGITLIGNGKSITSAGDCVIRMDDGAAITLVDVKLVAGADAIGCLGSARIGGTGWSVEALTNGIHCAGDLTIPEGSSAVLQVQKGSGIIARSLTMGKDAFIEANGVQSAVHAGKDGLSLGEGARLFAYTNEYYCALKCAGLLQMKEGATLEVQNNGDYHGAELDAIQVDGSVTILAEGGKKGAGLFLFALNEDITVAGHSEPEIRFESGNGSLHFVDTLAEVPAAQAAENGEQNETEEDAGLSA